MISLLAIQAICNSKREEIEAHYPWLVKAMERWSIDTPLRQAMFIAQAAHETLGFKYRREIASGQAYEGRADLGNTQPGDGKRFCGRGDFMLTGRANYKRYSEEICWPRDLLLTKPELLEEHEHAANSGGWFWDWKDMNHYADVSNIIGSSHRINGGENGLAERIALYKRALQALGIRQ